MNKQVDEIKEAKKSLADSQQFPNLSGQDDEEATKKAEALFVIGLHDRNGTDGVGVTPTIRDPAIGKDGDDDVLLDVERPGIQAESPPENAVLLRRQRGGHELPDGQGSDLHENGGDGEGLSAVGEEGVEEDEDDAGGQTQDPSPEGHHRHRRVVGLRHHQGHLLNLTPVVGKLPVGLLAGLRLVVLRRHWKVRSFPALCFSLSLSLSHSVSLRVRLCLRHSFYPRKQSPLNV